VVKKLFHFLFVSGGEETGSASLEELPGRDWFIV